MSTPSERPKELLMYKYFPKCPLCKSDIGYDFSGWIRTYAQCRRCKAKWFLGDYNMELLEAPEDGKGYSLLRKGYSYSFWQKLNKEELEAKEADLLQKAEVPFEVERTTGRDVVLFIFTLNFLLGFGASLYLVSEFNKLGMLSLPMVGFYLCTILLGMCFLAVVYWVADDGEAIRKLEIEILRLQQSRVEQKTNNQRTS